MTLHLFHHRRLYDDFEISKTKMRDMLNNVVSNGVDDGFGNVLDGIFKANEKFEVVSVPLCHELNMLS